MDLVTTQQGQIISNSINDLHFKKGLPHFISFSLLKLAKKHNQKVYDKF